ncbi:MAG: 5'/3'-nucleotidase SurE [Phycisphaerae bacterium]|nr:5'/3'-nucleotidase SurE [Phycisphaerae bacterium]
MRILLTNDDGIEAPGILALYDAIRTLGDVRVVAPADTQSASSHGITFHRPLMTRTMRIKGRMDGIAVEGRPADCVKIGLRALWAEWYGANERPDLVVSGMNAGANVGINVIYSGTVGAAVESAFLGVPAVAVSLHLGDRTKTNFERAAVIARHGIDAMLKWPLDAHRVMNLNVPRTESGDAPIPPIRVVGMNVSAGIDGYERRTAPGGQVYYWPSGNGMEFFHTAEDTDVEALAERSVTITPIYFDLTDRAALAVWKGRLDSK